jgi:hypothetical protein
LLQASVMVAVENMPPFLPLPCFLESPTSPLSNARHLASQVGPCAAARDQQCSPSPSATVLATSVCVAATSIRKRSLRRIQ